MPYKDKERERARSRAKAIRQYHEKKDNPEWYAEKLKKNDEYISNNRDKIREQAKKRKKLHKQKCLERLGGKCVKCGTTERLEFDHIDKTTKKYKITSGLCYSLDRLFEEVDKCQLLCKPCHIQKSIEQDDYH